VKITSFCVDAAVRLSVTTPVGTASVGVVGAAEKISVSHAAVGVRQHDGLPADPDTVLANDSRRGRVLNGSRTDPQISLSRPVAYLCSRLAINV
jgi:hypothetical protein